MTALRPHSNQPGGPAGIWSRITRTQPGSHRRHPSQTRATTCTRHRADRRRCRAPSGWQTGRAVPHRMQGSARAAGASRPAPAAGRSPRRRPATRQCRSARSVPLLAALPQPSHPRDSGGNVSGRGRHPGACPARSPAAARHRRPAAAGAARCAGVVLPPQATPAAGRCPSRASGARPRARRRGRRIAPPARRAAADIAPPDRAPITGRTRSPAPGRPARRPAHLPMPGQTSPTGAGRTAVPEPGSPRPARPCGGSATLGEEAAGMMLVRLAGWHQRAAWSGHLGAADQVRSVSAAGQRHSPGNPRRCLAGRERTG